jgi:pheromone shutdown protein TraB
MARLCVGFDQGREVSPQVKPQNVVVELCKSRAGVMYEDEAQSESDRVKATNQMGLRSVSAHLCCC